MHTERAKLWHVKKKKSRPNWPQISCHRYRILITGGSGFEKNKSNQIFIYFLYDKDPCEAKSHLLINKHLGVDLKHYNNYKAFIEHPNGMDDIYENIEEYNLRKVKY